MLRYFIIVQVNVFVRCTSSEKSERSINYYYYHYYRYYPCSLFLLKESADPSQRCTFWSRTLREPPFQQTSCLFSYDSADIRERIWSSTCCCDRPWAHSGYTPRDGQSKTEMPWWKTAGQDASGSGKSWLSREYNWKGEGNATNNVKLKKNDVFLRCCFTVPRVWSI